MRQGKQRNAEPIPGYRLIEPLGEGGFGEVWKCEAPGGLHKAIKFVQGDLNALDANCAPAEQELSALQHIKALRHPFLLSIERIESVGGELVIVMELADKSLQDVLLDYQAAGLPGVPRAELLAYLDDAAEALDVMNLRYGLQHLDIKPRNLFMTDDHVKVGDFGLVKRLEPANPGDSPAARLGGITPCYAAPEVLGGAISPTCDQYSLAVVYQELLTGGRPFNGKNLRRLLLQHASERPDLRPLPAADRPVVARALSKDWRQRFPSCRDFLQSLAAASVAAGTSPADEPLDDRPVLLPGNVLQRSYRAWLPGDVARLKLDGFCLQWKATVAHDDDDYFVLRVNRPRSVWLRWLGRQPALEVQIRLTPPRETAAGLTRVSIQVKACGCDEELGQVLVSEVGPLLLDSLSGYLQASSEQNTPAHTPWPGNQVSGAGLMV